MVISVSNRFTHKVPCKKVVNNPKELKMKVMDSLEKLGISSNEVRWNKEGHLELLPQAQQGLKLHTLMLQMESLGLDLKMTKKTLIEIS